MQEQNLLNSGIENQKFCKVKTV